MTPIDDKYSQLGGAQSFLGQPTTPEWPTPNGAGSFRHYQGGSIYWKYAFPTAYEVHGAIRDRWSGLGWENSFLGFPVTDELPTPDTRGRFNHFENGSIYWTPQTGAQEVGGAIRNAWAGSGWEQGPLGYPVAAPTQMQPSTNPTTFQDFERGSVYDWLGNTRTYIRTPSIVQLSGIMITWTDLGGLLPDMDRISVSFSGHNPNGVMVLTLNAGPGITWWKGVTLWSPTLGDIPAEAWTQDTLTSSSIAIAPSAVEVSNRFLLFKKAKAFGVHTGMYWLGPVDRMLGNDITLTWTRDW